jgi:two-component system, OmpR family, KDP operon response regulator KdpE
VSESPASVPPVALVIEDEAGIRRFLRAALESQGFTCVEAGTGREGIAHAATRAPEIILLDLGLPDMDGLDVMRRIREWSSVPIVVLTARGKEREKIDALDGGADDYVTKPFSVLELLARVRAARRYRTGPDDAPVLESGSLRIDMARRRVSVRGIAVSLTPIEYRLLSTLARHAGRVLTHEFLLREVWGPSSTDQRHYLRVYMAQLRQKLEADPSRPTVLMTEPGVGYRMADPETRS